MFVSFSRHRLVPLPQLPSCAMSSLEPTAVSTGFQTANVIKFPHSAFFPFSFRYPAHSPAQTPAKIARCAASASRQPKFGHQASTAGHGSRRFREWPKIPQHGSCISSFASKPHGSRSASRKPREKKSKTSASRRQKLPQQSMQALLEGTIPSLWRRAGKNRPRIRLQHPP